MKKQYNVLIDSPGRTIFFLVLPMISRNLFQQFYNIMDPVIVGRFVGEEVPVLVDASYSVTNVFTAIVVGGGIGSAVIVSQFLGVGQVGKTKTAISTTLINFLYLSVILGTVGYHMNGQIPEWMNTPDNVVHDAAVYLKIYFVGLPFLFMYNVQAAVLNSLGDSRTLLWLLIFSSFLNIVPGLVFVISPRWGMAGVAVVTLVVQGVSAVISFVILILKVRRYHSEGHFQLYDGRMVFGMLKVAVPSTLRQSTARIGMLLVQSIINGFGSSIMAGYAAATKIEPVSIVPMLAISNAMSAFIAQNMGAGQLERVWTGYCYGAMTVGVSAVILRVLLQLSGDTFIMAFLDPESGVEAFRTGASYVNFISLFFVFTGLRATTDGLLCEVGDALVFAIANLVNLTIRVFVVFQFAPIWGPQAVWLATPMDWATNYLISLARYLTDRRGKTKMVG